MDKCIISLLIMVNVTAVMLGCGSRNEYSVDHPAQSQVLDTGSVAVPATTADLDSLLDSKQSSKASAFKIPDDIERGRFVVAFYDSLCKCPVAIVYDNAKKKKATKITYYSDGQIDRTKLVPLSLFEFGERFEDFPEDKPHWDVYPAIVNYVHTNGSIGATYEVLDVE